MMMLGGRAGGGVGPGGGVGGGRCPFTASQWQELEHQALIYKYMASGVPIPSDLLLPLRRSFLLDSALATSPSLGFPPQAALGWGCFGMGFGRKAEDPEPGRCRRTDGKKWRCSKEAYPDSKYCEKHMHRGKNRSRKPVEMSLATPPLPSSSASSSSSNVHSAVTVATTTSSPAPSYHRAVTHEATPYHALYGGPYASAGRQQQQHAGAYHQHAAAAAQVSPFHLHLETTHTHPPPSYYTTMDHSKDTYAYGHSVKEVHGGGEHAFFTDSTDRDVVHHQHQHHASAGQWQFKQLGGMEPKQQHNPTPLFPGCNGGGGYGNNNNNSGGAYAIDLSGSKDQENEKERRQQQQHCFLLGTDLRLDKPSCDEQKPLRPFFDEWPHEKAGSKGSWMGLEGETQLSISIPMSANDLPITTTSRYHHGE